MSAVVGERAATSPVPRQFTLLSRILHWLTAILVFSALFIGFVMVNSLSHYAALLMLHKTIGAVVLVVMVLRVINRVTRRAPALPRTVGRFEKLLITSSETAMYGLLLAQPLVGWAMVSAGGKPLTVFGSLRLPPIAPVSLWLFSVLRETHSALAFLLVVIVAAHICAVLLHTIALGDGMLRRMTLQRMVRPRLAADRGSHHFPPRQRPSAQSASTSHPATGNSQP